MYYSAITDKDAPKVPDEYQLRPIFEAAANNSAYKNVTFGQVEMIRNFILVGEHKIAQEPDLRFF